MMETQVMRPEDVVTLWRYALAKRSDKDSWYGHVAIFSGDRYMWIMAMLDMDVYGDLLANTGDYAYNRSDDVAEGLVYDMSERAIEHINSAAQEMLRDRWGNVTMLSCLIWHGGGTMPLRPHPLLPILKLLHLEHADQGEVAI